MTTDQADNIKVDCHNHHQSLRKNEHQTHNQPSIVPSFSLRSFSYSFLSRSPRSPAPHSTLPKLSLTANQQEQQQQRPPHRLHGNMARSLSFDTTDGGPEPPLSSTTLSSSSSSRPTVAEVVLIVVLGLVVLVALASLCLCLRRKRMQKTQSSPRVIPLQHDGQNLHLSAQLQQSAIPLHQPPETPPALSSFTRISSTGPEMSSVLSGGLQRHPSTSSVSGFSLVRFFSKHSSSSTSVKTGRDVYLHNSRGSQYIVDMSSQKTPSVTSSTRSSSRDYTWDLSLSNKESPKGMFPIITLTSPTNSEASIAIPLQEEPQAAFFNSNIEPSASSSDLQSDTTISLGLMEQQDASSSMSAKAYSSPYQLRQSVPQHMLLHPSASYSRPTRLSEKQAPPLPPSSTPTDFPPTYEEAVDASDSRSNSMSMQVKPITTAHLAPQSAQSTGASSSSTSSSSAVQGCEGAAGTAAAAWPGFSTDEADNYWVRDAGAEIETDPLASLALPSNVTIQ